MLLLLLLTMGVSSLDVLLIEPCIMIMVINTPREDYFESSFFC